MDYNYVNRIYGDGEKNTKQEWCIKKGVEYVYAIRLISKDGVAAMSYTLTSDKKEAIVLCTRAAAYAIISAIEHHLVTGFEVSQF